MIVNLRKPVNLVKRTRPALIDPGQAYGFRLLVAARRTTVSLVKTYVGQDHFREQVHAAVAKRTLRHLQLLAASTREVPIDTALLTRMAVAAS